MVNRSSENGHLLLCPQISVSVKSYWKVCSIMMPDQRSVNDFENRLIFRMFSEYSNNPIIFRFDLAEKYSFAWRPSLTTCSHLQTVCFVILGSTLDP